MKNILSRGPSQFAIFAVACMTAMWIGIAVRAQTNASTLYGCTSITNCIGAANIPVLVDTAGRVKATLTGNGSVPTGVATGSVLASNGVGVQGVWTTAPVVTTLNSGYGTSAAVGLGIDANTGFYGSAGIVRISCGNVANCAVYTNGSASVNGNFTYTSGIMSGKNTTYNSVATAGYGNTAIYGYGDVVAATNVGTASIATYTVGASDGTFQVGCNINVTTSTTHSFSCDVTYTDEGNTARTMVLPVAALAGTFVTNGLITNVTGAGPYEAATMTIRSKAATAITVRTSAGGTFTTVVYNARGYIAQVG